MKQKIEPITDGERDWIVAQREGAAVFVGIYSPADAGQSVTLAALDRAWAAWMTTGETDTEVVNAVINRVGMAFGQFLVEDLGLSWVIASDELGTDLALHRDPGRSDVLIYPANFVAKRWERRETIFMETCHAAILRDVQAMFRRAGRKPWWKVW